jgi:hypothetical protein
MDKVLESGFSSSGLRVLRGEKVFELIVNVAKVYSTDTDRSLIGRKPYGY